MALIKLPTTLIDDGTPLTLIGRDGEGKTIEIDPVLELRKNWGLGTEYVSTTTIRILPGRFRLGNLVGNHAVSITKALDSIFVAGNGNGSLDVAGGFVAGNFLYIHLIRNNTTGVVDFLTSLSATTPTVPVGWTRLTRVGSVWVNLEGTIEPYVQTANYFVYRQPITNLYASLGNTNTSITATVPPQIDTVTALILSFTHGGWNGGANILKITPSGVDNIAVGNPPTIMSANNKGGPSDGGSNAQQTIKLLSLKTNTHTIQTSAEAGNAQHLILTYGYYDLEIPLAAGSF